MNVTKISITFPVDLAYNILSSCEKNAVLFTGGTNDTYPLWYLQFVEGYRTDVCVVYVPQLNFPTYVKQLINEPFSFPVDFSSSTSDLFQQSQLEGPHIEEIVINYSDNVRLIL